MVHSTLYSITLLKSLKRMAIVSSTVYLWWGRKEWEVKLEPPTLMGECLFPPRSHTPASRPTVGRKTTGTSSLCCAHAQ